MAITPVTATFPALNFPKEVDYPTQEDWAAFSAAAELNYGILSGVWSEKSEEFKAQTNTLALEIQEIGENAFNAISLNTIQDLATYTGTGLVIVKDLNRGGTFIYKTASEIDPNTSELYEANDVTVFVGIGGFWARQFSGAVNVKWAGVKGDGISDDTLLLQSVLTYYSGKRETVFIPDSEYLTSDTIILNRNNIYSENAILVCNNNNCIALNITGGAYYTNITGVLNVTRKTPWSNGSSQIIGAFGIKVNGRVNAEKIVSYGHYYDGVNFNATSNMNKSTYNLVESTSNARYGVFFDGLQNDISVWNINMRCQYNYDSGIYFDNTSKARQFKGHFYTEENCINTSSYGCYLGGLSSSELYIYSEEQNSIKEIKLPTYGDNNRIFTGRNSSDDNEQDTSVLIYGSSKSIYGSTSKSKEYSFVNLTNTSAKYIDIESTTSSGTLYQDRYRGDGCKITSVQQADNSKFSELKQTPSGMQLISNNGTFENPLAISVSTPISFKFSANTTGTRDLLTDYATITAVAGSVGAGNKGNGFMYFGTSNNSASSTNWIQLTNTGAFSPLFDNTQQLGFSSLRWSTIYAGTGTINTSDDREKTYIDITDIEKKVALELKANMKKFKFNDAIEAKGENGARLHFGASAQTVKSIFEKHGLNACNYGILCYDEWEEQEEIRDEEENIIQEYRESGNRYGLRYEELLCFIMSAL